MDDPYIIHIPRPPLSQFIECLWLVRLPYRSMPREKVLPNGAIELIFNLGDSFKVFNRADETSHHIVKKGWISGQQKQFLIIEQLGRSHMVGIRFKPGGAYPFLQMPISELSFQVIEADLVWGPLIEEIREQLAEAPTPQAQFARLEAILLERAGDRLVADPLVHYALQQIMQLDDERSIRSLLEDVGISHKHLVRRFDQIVGIGPKVLSRIYKFQKALHLIDLNPERAWTSIAQQCGYYDQAHFNRDFKSFTGTTPTQYLKQRGEDKNFIPQPE